MSSSRLSDSVQRLLETHVDTFDKLEIAVELANTPGQAVDRKQLSAGLSLPPEVFAASVLELEHTGLLVIQDDLIGPSSAHAVQELDELMRAYRADGVAIVRALSEIAMKRIRGMAARAFADAFMLRPKRKEEPDG